MKQQTENEVLVFKTALQDESHLGKVAGLLSDLPDINRWNVDLDDTDKVLRIETSSPDAEALTRLIQERMTKAGLFCEELTH